MAAQAIAFPIRSGREDQARQFAQEVQGPRRAEFLAPLGRRGITREQWYLQSGPSGQLILVYMEATDPSAALRDWAASEEPFDRWFKQQAGEITGLDFNQPLTALPEQVVETRV